MSLGFVTPLLLLALAGAVIPLIVHLLRQRQPRPTLFPPLVLLLGAHRRTARRRRLRDLLLMLVRMALLAAVPATLAGPFCTKSVPVPASASRRQAAVIVVDDSLSMQVRHRGQTLFDTARQRVRALLEVLPLDAPVALLTVSGQGSQVRELSLDRLRVRHAAVGLEPTWREGDAAAAVARAGQLLREAPAGYPRAVYLISDLTRTGLDPKRITLERSVTLQVIDVAGRELRNRGVVEARILRAEAAAGQHKLRVTVLNSSDRAAPGTAVRLRLGGRTLAREVVSIPARSTGKVTLTVKSNLLGPGVRFLRVATDTDALWADDDRMVALGRMNRIRVLLVDGDPRETRHDDELFYLEAAIRALAAESLPVAVQVVAAGDLSAVTLGDHDVVMLCNVGALDASTTRELARFVGRGGGLFVSLGNQVDPEYYHLAFGSLAFGAGSTGLLPGRLRSLRSGSASGPAGVAGRVSLVDVGGALAPVLADPDTCAALVASRIRRHGLVVPREAQVLLRLSGGAPLLLERRVGSGRVLLWTTTVDGDWTDLPLRPAFLPLVRAWVLHLSGQGDSGRGRPVEVGQTVRLRPAAGDRAVVVENPRGRRFRLPVGHGDTSFHQTELPGGYRVYSVGTSGALTELPASAFAVVLSPRESDLRRLAQVPHQAGALGGLDGQRRSAALRRDLTMPFALLCLLLLLAEALLAARFGQWRKQRTQESPA
ncbi:MAG: BatA domain-containing protein [bacterium]